MAGSRGPAWDRRRVLLVVVVRTGRHRVAACEYGSWIDYCILDYGSLIMAIAPIFSSSH